MVLERWEYVLGYKPQPFVVYVVLIVYYILFIFLQFYLYLYILDVPFSSNASGELNLISWPGCIRVCERNANRQSPWCARIHVQLHTTLLRVCIRVSTCIRT